MKTTEADSRYDDLERMSITDLLVNMNLSDDSWGLVKNTPGVTGFVGASQKPVPLSQTEVDRLLNRETAERPRTRAQFSIGEQVKDFAGRRFGQPCGPRQRTGPPCPHAT